MSRAALRLLRLPGWDICRMLRLEEALVRHAPGSWCLVNALPPNQTPTVVVGLGGKPHKLINADALADAPEPVRVVKRFTGGGTVVVARGTVVASLVLEKAAAPCEPFPREIMNWTEPIYARAFEDLLPDGALALRDHDYVVGDRKVGGNAQCIAKDKWIHHTSFLWDYADAHMGYLSLPEKRPAYRADRGHGDFVARLAEVGKVADPDAGADALAAALARELGLEFDIVAAGLEEVAAVEAGMDPDWKGGWKAVEL